ncbi:MAG: tetratricopeptide repeat protein [Planctomycetota bacterium]
MNLALALGLALAAAADVVHLRNGGRLEGKVVEKGDRIEVETPYGRVAVNRADVERIERTAGPPGTGVLPPRRDVRLGPDYAHPFLAFKIYLPPRWTAGTRQEAAAASFYGPPEGPYRPRLDLSFEPGPKALEDVAAAYKQALRKSHPGAIILFEESWAHRGRRAHQFSALFSEGDPPIAQQILFTLVSDGSRTAVLSFLCTQAWFDRYFGSVDASMRSLRLYPVPILSAEERRAFSERYNAGARAHQEGRLEEALAEFREAARRIPSFADLQSTLGMILFRLGRVAEAEAAYRKAAELDPEDYAPWYNLGVCLLHQSRYDAAAEVLEKALEREPAIEPGWTNLGVAHLGAGRTERAREALERAVRIDPESAAAHYNLGVVYERLGRRKEAEREFSEVLKIDPRHEEAAKALGRLRTPR